MQPSSILLSNYYFLKFILYGYGGNTGAGMVVCKSFQKTVTMCKVIPSNLKHNYILI
jgi:hypothetical protein